MKKLITLILILAVLIPAAGMAATTETQILGSWCGTRDTGDGKIDYFFYRFYNDGTVIKEGQSYTKDDYTDPMDIIYLGTWSRIGSAVNIRVTNILGQDSLQQLFLTEDGHLAQKLATCYIILTKLPDTVKKRDIRIVDSWD